MQRGRVLFSYALDREFFSFPLLYLLHLIMITPFSRETREKILSARKIRFESTNERDSFTPQTNEH